MPYCTAKEITGGLSGFLAHNIVERHVNCALRLRIIRCCSIHCLPDFLCIEWIKSNH